MILQVDDIQSLNDFIEQIGSISKYLVQEFSGELYHYTNLEALIGIVQKHDLWLTNSRFSNDETELNHGYEIAREVINRHKQTKTSTEMARYYGLVESLLRNPPQGVYICCFCERNNLLSQWRSYGENGTGVSIGFNPTGFQRFTGPDLSTEQYGLMRLWKVYYDDQVKEKIVAQALELIPEMHKGKSIELQAQKAAEAIHFFLPTFKNKDFVDEDERRLIFTPSKNCSVKPLYRYRRQMLVPYFSLNSLVNQNNQNNQNPCRLPIKSVMVGPSERKQINKESIELLMHNNNYGDADIEVSDTPYRG
ncbi:MAG TPA: DUF2971 domain-containing protein [Bacteroidales bacterium]|nr:DUF2971 domain-containing protein [Bacteroidales bacterium]